METIDLLNKEFHSLDFSKEHMYAEQLDSYKLIARNYARMENAIAVLSDLRNNVSYIYYGGFADMLAIRRKTTESKVYSIWEEEILKLVHPDDLKRKYIEELCFLDFVRKQPTGKRADYYLASKLRMRDNANGYIQTLHRMFYIADSQGTLWLALCLYSPLLHDIPAKCVIVNSTNGHMTEPENQDSTRILSARETQVLNLIDKGLTSKAIADMLSISVNTVSRHRQEILGKLKVKNSIEACRIAKDLKLI